MIHASRILACYRPSCFSGRNPRQSRNLAPSLEPIGQCLVGQRLGRFELSLRSQQGRKLQLDDATKQRVATTIGQHRYRVRNQVVTAKRVPFTADPFCISTMTCCPADSNSDRPQNQNAANSRSFTCIHPNHGEKLRQCHLCL